MSMLDTIILLTGAVEQPVLGSILQGHNPALAIRPVATLAELTALAPELLDRARLVAFCTGVIVPLRVLDRLRFGAYNFHPGSPEYPGWGCAHFAMHQEATEFGATAHVMIEKVDAGPIVGVELFYIPPGTTVTGLEEMAYACLALMFRRLARALATQATPLRQLATQWSGRKCTRRRHAAIQAEALGGSRDEPAWRGPTSAASKTPWAGFQDDSAPAARGPQPGS
jgi:methionyl-tRNA formyltransferase